MKETFILTKILLKNSLNKNIDNEKMNFKAIVKKLFLFLAIAYIACVVGFLSKELIVVLKKANQEQLFISLCLFISIIFAFIQSILSSLNVLYFSKDIEFLLPLPVNSIKIVFAKFNVMIISEYIIEILTFLIPFSVYGFLTMQEPAFYFITLIIFLLIPIIPILLAILVTVILMNVTSFLNNKDLVQYITVFFVMGMVILMQLFILKTSNMTEFMFVNKLLEINGLSNSLSNYIIILKQSMLALTEYRNIDAIKNILYLFAENITAYFAIGFLVSKSYIKSAINITSTKTSKFMNNNINQKSIGKAYIIKEFKMLFRTPVFFLNTVLPVIILPILFFIPIHSSINGVSQDQITTLISIVSENIASSIGLAICICLSLIMFLFNYVSVTCISRDGENAVFMKYIPIELHKQCRYKAVPSIILNLYSLIIQITVLKISFSTISNLFLIEIFIVSFLCNIFISYAAVLIDLLNPKLHWTTEYSVVKQNINMLWETIFIFIIGIIIVGICSYFENVHVLAFFLSALLILTTVFYDNFMKQNSVNIFKKIF